ncbi:hypothetical protein [Spirosoma rhododendri]|uniref:Uncharacterized protein n=1 Tax=Spirosoma rhododendri TaxID=2728024 RepID=A0A7L5DGI4_9BACT|nr:hypothetical protein [Spirosoma rhododendri]QJD77289.1 hypothetical protein HH216_01775 [Spirosoma rhododendri]
MKNFISLSEEQQCIYCAWVFAPIVALALSLAAGLAAILLLPLLLTVGYYVFFRQYSSARHPAWCFLTLPLTVYIWLRWGLDDSVLPVVLAYYVSQLINSFTIPLIFKEDYTDTYIGWLVAHTAALLVWLVLHALLRPHDNFFAYTIIELIAQSLSGFFLFGRYTVN